MVLISLTKHFCYLLVFRNIKGVFSGNHGYLITMWISTANMFVFYNILSGTNWKTAMLVLSPLAFILGLIILTLNVHYNK